MGLFGRLFGKKMPLVEAVELTSVGIFVNAFSQVRALVSSNPGFAQTLGTTPDSLNRAGWDLVFELMAFTLHLADRVAFGALGPERRARFIDALLQSVSTNLANSLLEYPSLETRAQFEQSFLDLYAERTQFYAGLGFPSGKDAPLQGTLFWEAAKLCASRHLPTHGGEATLALVARIGSCIEALGDLRGRLSRLADA